MVIETREAEDFEIKNLFDVQRRLKSVRQNNRPVAIFRDELLSIQKKTAVIHIDLKPPSWLLNAQFLNGLNASFEMTKRTALDRDGSMLYPHTNLSELAQLFIDVEQFPNNEEQICRQWSRVQQRGTFLQIMNL